MEKYHNQLAITNMEFSLLQENGKTILSGLGGPWIFTCP